MKGTYPTKASEVGLPIIKWSGIPEPAKTTYLRVFKSVNELMVNY